MTDLRYPVGVFSRPASPLSRMEKKSLIADVAETPARLRRAVSGLTNEQLDVPYRPDGWTSRQVAHHVPDSHLNAFIRLKLALTETEPAIRLFDEAEWAKLADVRETPLETSLDLLDSLHRRWVVLWESLSESQFARTLRHPDYGIMTLDQLLAQYAWHGRHHVAHITSLRERRGWN
jgi:DinB family protein